MTPPRIWDRTLFALEAAFFNWEAMLGKGVITSAQFQTLGQAGRTQEVALRWHVAGHRGNFTLGGERGIGLPTGPFTVWRRISQLPPTAQPAGVTMAAWGALGYQVGRLTKRLAAAEVSVEADGPSVLFGLADPSDPLSIVAQAAVPAGTGLVWLHGQGIAGVLALANVEVKAVKGVAPEDYHALPGWRPIELAGPPVGSGPPQGLVGSLVAPRDAALGRLDRGAPPMGWDREVEPGAAAPPWRPPDGPALLDGLDDLLGQLREVLAAPQPLQAAIRQAVELPPPATLAGVEMPADPSVAHVSPLAVLQASVASDLFLSLALGYGATLAEPATPVTVPAYQLGSKYDYMVTAPYAHGLDGRSAAVDLVAYAPRPLPATFPPVPAGLEAAHLAHEAPQATDAPWSAGAVVGWERPPPTTLFRVCGYAAARRDDGATSSRALMEERPGGGPQPIAPALSADDPEADRVQLTDAGIRIPSDPGSRSVRYSVATSNLFGLWSAWRTAPHAVDQPPPSAPRIVSATLTLPGELVVDFTWDWRNRAPQTVELLGTLYLCAERGTEPPVTTPPAGLDRTPGGGQPSVVLTFAGDTAGADLRYLDAAGDADAPPGPAQSEVRRYRLTVPGFSADFRAAPHAGLALWIRGTERLAPHRPTPATGPVVVFASDAAAPAVAVAPPATPAVPLGSLPDAQGSSHGRLAWPAVPGAEGYSVYTADEPSLLAYHGVPEPPPDATLTARYATLLGLPGDRTPFTRVTSRPVTETALDVVLPRGSRAIHLYAVISAGPGATEGPWPEAFSALAAPRVAAPPPPELVATGGAAGTVALEATARGATRVDVHRVRVPDAARRVETMGPPIAPAGWAAEGLADGRARFRGTDAPGASWKRVFYRAVAWSEPEPDRGLVRGASRASSARDLIVPPPTPPAVSAIEATWPGGALADVRLDFGCPAPVAPTPLGPHRLAVHVDGLLDAELDLDAVPSAGEVSRTGSAYHVLARRPADMPPLTGYVRVTDPLGRTTERRIDVPAGLVLPAPELADSRTSATARGPLLTFTSGAPVAAPPGGPYTLRAVGRPKTGKAIEVVRALAEIPVVRTLPETADPLLLVRQGGTATRRGYAVLAQAAVTRIDVTLRSPDGRTATATSGVLR